MKPSVIETHCDPIEYPLRALQSIHVNIWIVRLLQWIQPVCLGMIPNNEQWAENDLNDALRSHLLEEIPEKEKKHNHRSTFIRGGYFYRHKGPHLNEIK
jgi:hypothetical protein